MSRGKGPDHLDPKAHDGIRQRRAERGLPITPLNVMSEVARLKEMGWADLRREAKALGVPEAKIGGAATRDEVRLAIIDAKIEAAR